MEFSSACKQNNLLEAKRIYSFTDKISIRDTLLSTFLFCCKSNHIDVTKWLFEISREEGMPLIDIREHDDSIFLNASECNNIETARWCCEICNKYYIEIYEGKIIKYGIW